jgi:hypothetical protein
MCTQQDSSFEQQEKKGFFALQMLTQQADLTNNNNRVFPKVSNFTNLPEVPTFLPWLEWLGVLTFVCMA